MIKSVQRSPEWPLDPVGFVKFFWPHITLYDKQREILESVRDNDETYVPAANGMGKDFVAGLCGLWFFCSRSPARVLTTSVQVRQLEIVLWGEMRRFIQEAAHRLPLLVNHLHMRKLTGVKDEVDPRSELVGFVAKAGEGYLGMHLDQNPWPRCLGIFDEASGIPQDNYDKANTWLHRKLIIGNCFETTNFFRTAVREGNLPHPHNPNRMYRKVIQIRAVDSPNVQLGMFAEERGLPIPPPRIPGLLPYDEYIKRRTTWNPILQTVSLDAEFYEGAEVKMYPPAWLAASGTYANSISGRKGPRILACDGAEGGDDTVWTVIDDLGILDIIVKKTPNTTVIHDTTLNLMKVWNIAPADVYFDQGGGGTPQVDFLRRTLGLQTGDGFNTIAFGATASDPNRFKRMRTSRQKATAAEHSGSYKNRRAEMFGLLRELLDPGISDRKFGIPFGSNSPDCPYKELRRQLSLIPFSLDSEGKMVLPPKRKRKENELSLTEIMGRSPDHSDSLVMAVYGLYNKQSQFIAGAL